MATEFKPASKFGHPVPRSTGVSQAYWGKSTISPYPQKGSGWQIILNPGVQSGSNWAGVYIPCREIALPHFKQFTQWSWYQTNAESMGVNLVLWAHDPKDPDKRAEITQLANISGLDKGSGWNSHELVLSTDQFYWYGENVTNAAGTATALTEGTPNYYGLDDFQADIVFRDWTVYRVSLEHGWDASGTYEHDWIADIKLNGETIELEPTRDDLEAPVYQWHTATSGAIATALSPKTPFQLLSIALKINTAGTTSENFTAAVDAGRGTAYDTNLITQNTKTPAITDATFPFGTGYEFLEDDEIDCAWPNTEARTYGLTYAFRVLP